tara:strand:- start:4654 stop:4797 length:144 start_codon:yes stop_codon:yes gene_type:complete
MPQQGPGSGNSARIVTAWRISGQATKKGGLPQEAALFFWSEPMDQRE